MDAPLLRVGEFLRRTRLSPKALRLYAAQGLLPPAHVDPVSGYRLWSADQVERARVIALLRRAGMPLARVRDVVDLGPAARSAAVGRWWAGVAEEHARRAQVVAHVTRGTDGEGTSVYDVEVRDVPELRLLSAERRLTVAELSDFIGAARREIAAALAAAGVPEAGPVRVVYHGMVTEDGDGPVEVAVPFTGSVDPVGELRVRRQAARREAVTRLSRDAAEFPGILDAYDAVARWIDAAGLQRAGSPAEVYLTDRSAPDDGGTHVEVAWPVR
ncbi:MULTISPECIES: MerR family transcriptional regulator [unclassified Blastococcus]